jgi:hypothetical protein
MTAVALPSKTQKRDLTEGGLSQKSIITPWFTCNDSASKCCHHNHRAIIMSALAQNTTQKSIPIAFCVSSICHDSSLSKYRKQKQTPPPGNTKNGACPGGWLLLFTVLAEWRIMMNRAYAKSNGDGLLCSILWHWLGTWWQQFATVTPKS